MSDRELLQDAARAAGVEVTAVVAEGIPHRFGGGYWNPLTEDGDALRLAVKLNMTVRCYMGNTCAQISTPGLLYVGVDEFSQADPAAATRRAIVRAAAEIGRAK